jgi:tetratricopeptide (TPR) repeat protein
VNDASTPAPAPTHHVWAILKICIPLAIIIPFTIWVFINAFRKTEEPGLLLFKWVSTVALAYFTWFVIGPIVRGGGYAAMGGIIIVMACGWVFAFIWRRNLASMFAKPFADLYTGGDTPPDPTPLYSMAIAQRKRGYYDEAIATVRKELERFPEHFEGELLLAEIQAENLNDLPGAAITIERICNQKGHTPRNIALALNTLADWYLKYNHDLDTARETLQRITDLIPDTEMSVLASQRIATLSNPEHRMAKQEPKSFAVVEGVKNIGLIAPEFHPKPAQEDASMQAGELVAHLQSHPLDADARERLAVIYSDHYNRLEMATDQLEQNINHPNQPQKRVVHWLNLLADLQVRNGATYETVRATVQRIIDRFPKSAASEVAANRIAHLKLELKAKQTVESVKLGTYEQDIGLKMKK